MDGREREAAHPLTLDFTSVGPDSGGVGAVAAGVARGLIDNGVELSCAVSSLQLAVWEDRVPELEGRIRSIDVSLAATSQWQMALRRIVPRSRAMQWLVGRVRRVRAWSTRSRLSGGVVWLPFHRVPLASDLGVVTVHDLRVFEPHLASPVDQQIIEENVHNAKAVVCSWAHPYNQLRDRFPTAEGKTFLIPLPVLNPGTPRARKQPADSLRLLLPGYVTPHKNHEVLVRALRLLPGSVAVFTGSEDGKHGEMLRELASGLGVSDRIEWRGFVTPEELEREYGRADLLVMPTRWEAASGPVYEAIARELPFVASNIPPIRSQLNSLNLASETFDCDSPQELAAAVVRTVARYGEHVNEIAAVAPTLRHRTWEATAADYQRVFDWVSGIAAHPADLTTGQVR